MTTPISQSVHSLQRQAAALLIYQDVLEHPVGRTFLQLLDTLRHPEPDELRMLRAYGQWFSALAEEQMSWQAFLLTRVLRAENPFTRQVQQSGQRVVLPTSPPAISSSLMAAARHDLRSLQHLYGCNGQQINEWIAAIYPAIQVEGSTQLDVNLRNMAIAWEDSSPTAQALRQLPIWKKLETTDDWGTVLEALIEHYQSAGVGDFAAYSAFRWQAGALVGVPHPDPIRLDALVGYEMQREELVKNTKALLAGYLALHVLLYGSRGSGKSSLVKGLLNEYAAQGLRLLEISKADLHNLPIVVDRLRDLPQKFIIFVDDLSFEDDDDAFKSLKVVLEGNITARPQNVVVYATSNRRHLVREQFGDRPRPKDADEIHSWDTVQEKLSFSDRFGLTLTFEPADQNTYLAIVRHLAEQANLEIDPKELEFRALQWATRHNGRSGRTARQFVDFLRADLSLF